MSRDRRTAAVATAAVLNREATTATDTKTLPSASDERPRFAFSDMTNREFAIWSDGHFWGGVHEAQRVDAVAEAAFAKIARRLRETANEPSHQELVGRRRRHQGEAANRATGHTWPQEVT